MHNFFHLIKWATLMPCLQGKISRNDTFASHNIVVFGAPRTFSVLVGEMMGASMSLSHTLLLQWSDAPTSCHNWSGVQEIHQYFFETFHWVQQQIKLSPHQHLHHLVWTFQKLLQNIYSLQICDHQPGGKASTLLNLSVDPTLKFKESVQCHEFSATNQFKWARQTERYSVDVMKIVCIYSTVVFSNEKVCFEQNVPAFILSFAHSIITMLGNKFIMNFKRILLLFV